MRKMVRNPPLLRKATEKRLSAKGGFEFKKKIRLQTQLAAKRIEDTSDDGRTDYA